LIADEQTRTDVALKRGFFRRFAQRFMDSTRFIFFDETSAKTNMTRLYGRSTPLRTAIGRRRHSWLV
jgi:hypothetical protein